ncbi:hypothetical protein H8959_021684 [Pygathrix nigripes]
MGLSRDEGRLTEPQNRAATGGNRERALSGMRKEERTRTQLSTTDAACSPTQLPSQMPIPSSTSSGPFLCPHCTQTFHEVTDYQLITPCSNACLSLSSLTYEEHRCH